MKECMYSYHYNQRRAIVRKDQSSHRVFVLIIGIVAIFSVYCLSTLVRA